MINTSISECLEQLVEGMDRGDFSDPCHIPDSYTYMHLYAMFFGAGMLDGGVELFRQLYDAAMRCACAHVREKHTAGETLRVVFMTPLATTWQAESVYRLLEGDARFTVSVMPVAQYGRPYEVRRKQYEETLRYFRERDYTVTDTWHPESDTSLSWEECGELPDIVINLNAYEDEYPESLRILSLPLRCMLLYFPYGIYLVENETNSYMDEAVFFNPFINLVYRMYTGSAYLVQECRERMLTQGKCAVFSGFPKMDYFYAHRTSVTEEEIRRLWKIPDGADAAEIRRVIIAPHHSVMKENIIKFSTFPENAHFLPELAGRFRDRISFVFKPHPHLRRGAVESGLFGSFAEYDAYVEAWDALPNASVVTEDSYLELFATSDAMIMDSGSFIGEYLYADKPLLYLTRPEQRFNALGEKLMRAHYTAPGDDLRAMEAFLQDVVLGGADTKRTLRRQIFQEELDYVSQNGCLAGEMIYKDICAAAETAHS